MFQRVIVPLDGSKTALQAVEMAVEMPAVSYELLTVLPSDGEISSFWESSSRRERFRIELEQRAREALDQAAAALQSHGRVVETAILTGDPAEEIIRRADPDDLIVMTTRGYGAGRRMIYGSVSDRVARHGAAPVLLVRVTEETEATEVPRSALRRIIIPLDGSELAEQALPVGAEIAAARTLPMLLVRALDIDMLRAAVRAGATAAAAYADSLEIVRHAAAVYLGEQAEILREQGLAAGFEVRDNAPETELLAMTGPADLIVMTTQGRGGVKRWLLGSVAEKMTRLAKGPVLLVRAASRET